MGEAVAGEQGSIAVPTATDILATEGKTDVPDTRGSLFGEVAPSEDELSGVDDETPTEPVTKEAAPSPPKDQEEEKPSEEQKKTDAPPSGFVPKKALDEERSKRKEEAARVTQLQEMITRQQEQINTLLTKTLVPEKADEGKPVPFKELTPEEFKALKETDYDAALDYLADLASFKAAKAVETVKLEQTKETTAAQQRAQQQQLINEIQSARTEMETSVPGIFDDANPINDQLIQFAEQNGMGKDYLLLFTDPGTIVTTADGKNSFIVGKGASGLVKMLYQLYSRGPQLESEVTEKVTKEIAGKLKTTTGGFKSIGDAPKGADESASTRVVTEAEFHKMSPEEQRRYLGG